MPGISTPSVPIRFVYGRRPYRIRDIVQLEVDEHLLPFAAQSLHDGRTDRRKQLQPHLVQIAMDAASRHKRMRRRRVSNVQRYDRGHATRHAQFGHSSVPMSERQSVTP